MATATMDNPEWFTPAALAERWQVDPSTVRRWIGNGRLGAMKLPGGDYRVHRTVVLKREQDAILREQVKAIRRVRHRGAVKDRIGALG